MSSLPRNYMDNLPKRLTVGSLFSGIGGLDLGLERAGMQVVWQCENDQYCCKILEKHWPAVRRWRDVRTFLAADATSESSDSGSDIAERGQNQRAASWLDCDLIAGGFPCQPVSIAGRRQAERDPRWLWPHFARVLRLLRPRYALLENVPGLLLPGAGGLGIFTDLAALGYDAEWATLPASAFGAPHIRERVFAVAYANGERGQRRRSRPSKANSGRPQAKAHRRGSTSSDRDRDRDSAQARIFRAGGEIAALPRPCWGTDKPGVARTSHGTAHRMERIAGLGNAVVPAVAEFVGLCILQYDKEVHHDQAAGRE